MAFSFEQTIAIVNNAANELTRAARDFGDERPDDDPLAAKLTALREQLADVMRDLSAERDRAAAGGTSPGAPVVRDVKRDPDGMASPGADLPDGVTEKTIAADQKAVAKAQAEAAERQRAEAERAAATVAVVQPVAATSAAKNADADADKKTK